MEVGGTRSGISSSRRDAGCLVQNASGANTAIVKWQGHAGRSGCRALNGDGVSWRSNQRLWSWAWSAGKYIR